MEEDDEEDDEDQAEGLPIPSSDAADPFPDDLEPAATLPPSSTLKAKSKPSRVQIQPKPRTTSSKIKADPDAPSQPKDLPPRPLKRKDLMDIATTALSEVRNTRLKTTEVKAKERTTRKLAKEDRKLRMHEANVKLERAKLEHSRQEAALQRAHELAMMERQVELERLRRHDVGPVGLAPPPPPPGGPQGHWALDPTLR